MIVSLSITLYYCHRAEIPEDVEHYLEICTYTSIFILTLFMIEFSAKICVFGCAWFKDYLHVIDFSVVLISLIFELMEVYVEGDHDEGQIMKFLVMGRLWRILKLAHTITEVKKLEKDVEMKNLEEEVAK